MNNKTYANYLMHGRTKGSRNGISTTKGYTAVGQKAKGKIVNGKYVYDTPVAYGGKTEKPEGVSQEYWDELQYNTNPNYKPEPKKPSKGIDTNIDPRFAVRSSQHGTPWVSEEYKQELAYNTGQHYTPKKNSINVKTDPRFRKSTTNTGMAGDPRYSVSGTSEINKAKVTALAKAGTNNWQQQAALEQWKKQNQNAIAAKKTAAKQPTNIGASQSAELARWKQQNRNNIAASKKAAKQQELIKKADASYTASQGKANNWQAQANTQRAMKEYMNKASDERKAESAKRSASYNKMSSTQKNAMQNDPRYSTGLGANNSAMLYSGPRGKYDYSGKNDSRAPTLITFNGSEKMNRDPYFETWAKSTNKQEVAAAQAKNKEFMNDFRKSKERNSRSDLGNAIADAKEDAKNAFKALKKKLKKKK